MSYLGVIKIALFVFPFLGIFLTIPFLIYHYRKYGSISFLRFLVIFSFIFYLLCCYFLVILPLPSRNVVANYTSPYYNLKPFFVVPEIVFSSKFDITNPQTYIYIFNERYFESFFNILMLVPFGIYLRYYFKCDFFRTLIFSFFLSLFFEITQFTGLYHIYPRPYRLCDVTDLINNTFGGILGYFFTPFFSFFLPSRDRIDFSDYLKGNCVSVFRSGLSVLIDYFFIFLFCFLLYFFHFKYLKLIYLILSFIVFVVVPFISNGYSFGKWFLRIRCVGIRVDGSISFFKYFIRWFFLHLFIFNGWILILIFNNRIFPVPIYFWFIYLGMVMFFLIYCFNCLIIKRDIFINNILGISCISEIFLDEGDFL
jgi:glycopeptide antibiotics resistance protein